MSESSSVAIPIRMPASTIADLRYFYVHPPAQSDPEKLCEPENPDSDASSISSSLDCRPSAYFQIKPSVDRTLTALLMLVGIPLMLLIAVAIVVCQGRPIFYRQTRVGKDGKLFRIWKFRSMRPNAEQVTGAAWSGINDPRVTAFGRLLRATHLDELPQLFNILAGDMNLVGPRPERPEFVQELSRELPHYQQRLKVRPGITGLAQVHLHSDQSVADVEKKVELDLQYVQSATFRSDTWLMLKTVPHIVGTMLKQVRNKQKPAKNNSDSHTHFVTAQSIVPSPAHMLNRTSQGLVSANRS